MKIAVFYENIHDGMQATGQKLETVLARLHELGMDLLYLTPESWKRDRRELSALMEKLNLGIEGMHCFCDFPGGTGDSSAREAVELASEAGAGNLLIIPGMYSTGNTEKDLDRMVQGIRRTVEYGGTKKMPILMEDFDGILAPYNCAAGLQYFMKAVDGLGCAFDTGNFAMFGENEAEAFELFADRIRTVHLKDRTRKPRHEGDYPFLCADGKPVYACEIGSGYIRIAEILERLKGIGYGGNVIVEQYSIDPKHVLDDAAASVKWTKEHLQGA